jgi:hypothetical protein
MIRPALLQGEILDQSLTTNANNQQPTTNSQQPTANNQQPQQSTPH